MLLKEPLPNFENRILDILPRSCFFYFAPAILCAQASYKHEIQPGGAACSDCDAKKGFIKKYWKTKKLGRKHFFEMFKKYFWENSSKDFHLKLKNVENPILNGNPY